MVNWWLATISLVGFLGISIGLVLYTMKISIQSDDSLRIDPLPENTIDKKK